MTQHFTVRLRFRADGVDHADSYFTSRNICGLKSLYFSSNIKYGLIYINEINSVGCMECLAIFIPKWLRDCSSTYGDSEVSDKDVGWKMI